MPGNRAEQVLGQPRFIKELADMRHELEALKAKQLLGVDNIQFVASIENNFGPIAVGPNSNWWRDLRFTGAIDTAFVSELGLRFYIDNDNDENYRLPLGPSLSPGQLKCYASAWHDHHEGALGEKWYHIPLINGDSVSHNFYGHFILMLNKGAVAS